MRDLFVLFVHLVVTTVRLMRPGGARAIVAESLLLKQQLLIVTRSRRRAPDLRPLNRVVAGLCAGLTGRARIRRCAIVLKPATILSGCRRSRPFLMYRSHTPSWNAWSGQSGANISTRCRFGTPGISNENWTRSRNITTVIGCIRGSRDKYPTRELAAKTSQQFASMTTAGILTAAAYFNYQWRLELEFAPHRLDYTFKRIDMYIRYVFMYQLIGRSHHGTNGSYPDLVLAIRPAQCTSPGADVSARAGFPNRPAAGTHLPHRGRGRGPEAVQRHEDRSNSGVRANVDPASCAACRSRSPEKIRSRRGRAPTVCDRTSRRRRRR